MSKEKEEKQSSNQQTFSSVIGEVVWLLINSKAHRHNFFLGDLEWMTLPAITNGQFRIFRNDDKPVGAILWAKVSDEVEKKLEQGKSKLAIADWKGGENIWIIDVIAPFGKAEEMVEDLKKNVFEKTTFKYFRYDKEGKRETVVENG